MRITPGRITGTGARELTATIAKAESARAELETMRPVLGGDFPARLTAYDATTGFYSWTHRTFDSDRERYDYPNGKTGTTTYMPARSINGEVYSVPVDVWLRPIGASATLGMVHEIVAGPTATPFDPQGIRLFVSPYLAVDSSLYPTGQQVPFTGNEFDTLGVWTGAGQTTITLPNGTYIGGATAQWSNLQIGESGTLELITTLSSSPFYGGGGGKATYIDGVSVAQPSCNFSTIFRVTGTTGNVYFNAYHSALLATRNIVITSAWVMRLSENI